LVALFVLLLAIAVIAPVAGIVRGPTNPALLSWVPQRAVFDAAEVDVSQFAWARIAIAALVSFVLAGAATLLFRQRRRNAAATVLSFSFLCLAVGMYGLLLL
jgi:cytochrome bd-type quinol oxidase subunit 2